MRPAGNRKQCLSPPVLETGVKERESSSQVTVPARLQRKTWAQTGSPTGFPRRTNMEDHTQRCEFYIVPFAYSLITFTKDLRPLAFCTV